MPKAAPVKPSPRKPAPPAPAARPSPARPAAPPKRAAAPAPAPSTRNVAPPAPESTPRVSRGRATGAVNAARPAPVAGPSKRETELAAELTSVKAELAKLVKATARVRGPIVRSEAEIVEDPAAELIAAENPDDWRHGYHGRIVYLHPFHRATGNGTLTLTSENPDDAWRVLIAIPTDADGSYGPIARESGELSLYRGKRVDGSYTIDTSGPHPSVSFVNAAELETIWHHERNEAEGL